MSDDSRINTSLSKQTHRDLKRLAGILGLTVSEATEEAAQMWMARNRKRAKKVAEEVAA